MTTIRLMELIDTSEAGGGQVHVAALLRGIDRSAFEVTTCAAPGSPLDRLLQGIDCEVVPVGVRSSASPRSFFRIVRELERRRIDLLHVHGGVAGMWGRLAAVAARTPHVVYTCHGLHFLYKKGLVARRGIRAIERVLSRLNNGLIYVSEHDRRLGEASGVPAARKVRVIRNGIDPKRYQGGDGGRSRPDLPGIPRESPVFGSIGRLHPQKGHLLLLEAMEGVVRQHPEARLLLVGEGPLRPVLEERVSRSGLAGHVRFLGRREDVPELLRAIDLFVLASHWEGLPLSLLEAMASGTPVVAPRIGGVLEVVEDGRTGFLFTPGSPGELSGLMTRFLDSRGDFLEPARLARERVASDFTLERMVRETTEFLMEIGHEDRPGP